MQNINDAAYVPQLLMFSIALSWVVDYEPSPVKDRLQTTWAVQLGGFTGVTCGWGWMGNLGPLQGRLRAWKLRETWDAFPCGTGVAGLGVGELCLFGEKMLRLACRQ